jgi:hypothetical protein
MRERESNSRVALRAISEADALCAPLTSIPSRAPLRQAINEQVCIHRPRGKKSSGMDTAP